MTCLFIDHSFTEPSLAHDTRSQAFSSVPACGLNVIEQTLQLCPLNVFTNVQSGTDHNLHKPLLIKKSEMTYILNYCFRNEKIYQDDVAINCESGLKRQYDIGLVSPI